MMGRSARGHRARGACRDSGHCPNSCPPASTTAFIRPCPFLARRIPTPVKFQHSPPVKRSLVTRASRCFLILPQEAFGLCGQTGELLRNRSAQGYRALKRLSQPMTKSTRTALHHPHHGGDKSGATLAWLRLKEQWKWLYSTPNLLGVRRCDRATVVPLRPQRGRRYASPCWTWKKPLAGSKAQPIQANCPVSLSKLWLRLAGRRF